MSIRISVEGDDSNLKWTLFLLFWTTERIELIAADFVQFGRGKFTLNVGDCVIIVGIGLVGSQLQQPGFNLVVRRATAASQLGLGSSMGQFFALFVLSLQQFLLPFLQFVKNSILFFQLFSQLAIFFILVNQKFYPAWHILVILFLADRFGTLQLSLPIFLHCGPEIAIYF